jgi:hypothetical protein
MAELTVNKPQPPNCKIAIKAGTKSCKLEFAQSSTGTSPLNPLQQLIFVRYRDHVLYNRSSALLMQPQIREAVGWLVYDCELYIIVVWDRDAQPPTLTGGDPKASGLVLLKSDILELQLLTVSPLPLQNSFDMNLNCKQPIQEDESAFRPSERKTQRKGNKK